MRGKTRLTVLRAERDLTQSQTARKAETFFKNGRTMSQSRYWQIENAEGSPADDDEKAAVAAAFGVKVGQIDWPARQAVAS